MWIIYEKRSLQKVINKAPFEIKLRYEAWKRIVEMEGPDGLRLIRGFHDEALKGKWRGFRSSRLGLKWRIIYVIEKGYFTVYVMEISPHDY